MVTATRKKPVTKSDKPAMTKTGRVVPKLRTPITPLEDYVLLLPDVANTVSAGGIVLPNATEDEKPSRAIVCAVGPGKYDSGVFVVPSPRVADYVIFDPYAGTEYDIEGVKYKLVRATHISAVIG
jgi:chaperonin GroES